MPLEMGIGIGNEHIGFMASGGVGLGVMKATDTPIDMEVAFGGTFSIYFLKKYKGLMINYSIDKMANYTREVESPFFSDKTHTIGLSYTWNQ